MTRTMNTTGISVLLCVAAQAQLSRTPPDWNGFPQNLSILLNEKLMFPVDLAAWKMKIDRKHQLFLDDYLIAHTTNLERKFHPVTKHPKNPLIKDFHTTGHGA